MPETLPQPAPGWLAITPDDATTLDPAPVALYVGVAGDVVITDQWGNDATLKAPQGMLQGVTNIKKVKASGTTATDIVGLYYEDPS